MKTSHNNHVFIKNGICWRQCLAIVLMMTMIWMCNMRIIAGFQISVHHNEKLRRYGNSMPLFTTKLTEVDVLYGSRKTLTYDPLLERYIPKEEKKDNVVGADGAGILHSRILAFLKRNFVPDGVTPSYYRFIKWRVIQRFINSIVHVLGTQSLLMGLGIKSKKSLGLSAVLNWVLKDALGKVVRLVWASYMGRKFDSDAKRWRFRSSIVYAIGNAMEIITYVQPQFFLLYATLANCFKQISFLTSSSTRTAIYNSFRTAENIADITAKGEAQVAVVDLLGILAGVLLSSAVGMQVKNVVGVYSLLQIIEIFCLHRMINAVEFRVLNFERLLQLVQTFVVSSSNTTTTKEEVQMPTPTEMAKTERIFLPPERLGRRQIAFGSLSRARLSPSEVDTLLTMFQSERFMLVVGENIKKKKRRQYRRKQQQEAAMIGIEENCHIVLHVDATNMDIVKATLALTILRQSMSQKQKKEKNSSLRSSDCWEEIRTAHSQCQTWFPFLLQKMSEKGWAHPARFMLGRVTMRAEWPIPLPKNATTILANN